MKFIKKDVIKYSNKFLLFGDEWGWFANNIEDMRSIVGTETNFGELYDVTSRNKQAPFILQRGNTQYFYSYFYPASYQFMQRRWVKNNNLRVGDEVIVVRDWVPEEQNFNISCGWASAVGTTHIVVSIQADAIESKNAWLPYFAIEKVKGPVVDNHGCYCETQYADHIINTSKFVGPHTPYFPASWFNVDSYKEKEYRAFANAEEFAPYRDDWFRYRDTEELARVTEYNDNGLTIGGQEMGYKHFFDAFSNDTKGIPAGVEI